MLSYQRLHLVFQDLEYLDDGRRDGYVSHAGLKRIVQDTKNQLSAEIGTPLTSALYNRAEKNLYGRLSFEDFLKIAHSVGGIESIEGLSNNTTNINHTSKTGYSHNINKAAANVVVPKRERSETVTYLDQYSCKPPPLFIIFISFIQIGIFVWHVIEIQKDGNHKVGPNGPPYNGSLIFSPKLKHETWRYLSYMLAHSGYLHITFNLFMQMILGIPLEMVHRWWRILLIYFCGVLAGSLSSAIFDPDVYLAGASGGVYAIIAAHLANIFLNWSEMEYAVIRITFFILFALVDTGAALYYRYSGVDIKISYVAHLMGLLVGFLLGVVVLKNLQVRAWERAMWWISVIVLLFVFVALCVLNAKIIAFDEE